MARQHYNIWTEKELAAVYDEYMAGGYLSVLAKRRGRKADDLIFMFTWRKWPLRAKKNPVQPKRIPAAAVEAMYADYQAGMTLADVDRKHSHSKGSSRCIFSSRGLALRMDFNAAKSRRPDGSFAPLILKTEEEIELLIQSATRLAVPADLAVEWRKWPLARRADFILRLRARLNDPNDRSELPFSSNIVPFDYATENAWDIVKERNAGSSSRYWVTKMDIRSQGVIWDGRLWFWSRKEHIYIEGVRWTAGVGRPLLHRQIFERTHGVVLTIDDIVRIIDGNPNNLDPSNLILADRNEVCRENQASAITRKSRERTAILLNRHQSQTNPAHDLIKRLA